MILRSAQDEASGLDLDGKKGHLDPTWTPVVRHLSGSIKSHETLASSGAKARFSATWTLFRKSIYTGCKKNLNHNHTSEVDHERL
jgi:hypothetical protein